MKFGPEEGQHVLWTLSNWKRVEVWEWELEGLTSKTYETSSYFFCHTIQIQAYKIIKKNRVPVNKELLTGTRSLSIRNY